MKTQNGGANLFLIILLLAIGPAGTYITLDWYKQKEKLEELESLRKIKSLDGILEDALTFEFAQVESTFLVEHKKRYPRPEGGMGVTSDKVHALYSAEYTFTFGYDTQDWNWCSKIIDQNKGIVQVRAPRVVWTNTQTSINPDVVVTIDGIFYTELEAQVQQDVKRLMTKKIQDKARSYLSDPKLKLNIERALSFFLQQTMNDAHEGNPISRVIISDTCDQDTQA
ncbi:MAG: hypothetical protein HUJ29_05650 [Gammaproteobacteria bacterium]|nr:hypothetical protein [Gammaproteobacteria bacterium]